MEFEWKACFSLGFVSGDWWWLCFSTHCEITIKSLLVWTRLVRFVPARLMQDLWPCLPYVIQKFHPYVIQKFHPFSGKGKGFQTTQGWFPFQTDHFTIKHDAPWWELYYFKHSTPTQSFWSDSFHPYAISMCQTQGFGHLSSHLSSDFLIGLILWLQ